MGGVSSLQVFLDFWNLFNFAKPLSSPSLAGEHGKRHDTRAHNQEAVSDWLNPHSLGTMSASGCMENLA